MPTVTGFTPETLDAIKTAAQAGNGNGLTFSRVVVTQAGDGFKLLLKIQGEHKTLRLHALVGTMDAAGTLLIESNTADDGNGTATALSGVIPLDNKAGMVIPFCADSRGCLASKEGGALGIRTVTGKFFGYAIVSTD